MRLLQDLAPDIIYQEGFWTGFVFAELGLVFAEEEKTFRKFVSCVTYVWVLRPHTDVITSCSSSSSSCWGWGLSGLQCAAARGRMHSSPLLLLLASASLSLLHLSNGLDFKHHNNTELAAVLQQVPNKIENRPKPRLGSERLSDPNSWCCLLCLSAIKTRNILQQHSSSTSHMLW